MKRAVWGWGEEVVGAIVRWGSGGIVRSVVDNCFFPLSLCGIPLLRFLTSRDSSFLGNFV